MRRRATLRTRSLFLTLSLAGFGALLLWGFLGLPDFGVYPGPYGDVINAVARQERHAVNAVAAVTFDYRGVDTLAEEFILFASVVGATLLLREASEDEHVESQVASRRQPDPSDVVRAWSLPGIAVLVVFGLYIILHGHVSPGGGFQGGAIVACAWLLLYLAGGHALLQRFAPRDWVELAEAGGAAAFAVVGLAMMLSGGAFLENQLPLGTPGDVASAGIIPLLSLAVGIEVAAAFILLLVEFAEETQKVEPWNQS